MSGGASLDATQREIVAALVAGLSTIPGVAALVLGGSHARGCARNDSDVDLGLFYREAEPLDLAALRSLCAAHDDAPDPLVTEPYAWGPWVNGGAWLTIRGRRVDLLYRCLDQVERVIREARAGGFELHFGQQPPFGFTNVTYLGEVATALPLRDPAGHLPRLQAAVARYPDALRENIVRSQLEAVEFSLLAFAGKFAARGDALHTAATLARCGWQLVQVLFALNRVYPGNDKSTLGEVAGFDAAPRDFAARVGAILAAPGASPDELAGSVAALAALYRETAALAGPLFAPRFPGS